MSMDEDPQKHRKEWRRAWVGSSAEVRQVLLTWRWWAPGGSLFALPGELGQPISPPHAASTTKEDDIRGGGAATGKEG